MAFHKYEDEDQLRARDTEEQKTNRLRDTEAEVGFGALRIRTPHNGTIRPRRT